MGQSYKGSPDCHGRTENLGTHPHGKLGGKKLPQAANTEPRYRHSLTKPDLSKK